MKSRSPYGVAVKNDKIFVALSKGRAVAIVDTKEKKVTYVGQKGRLKLQTPIGIAVGANDVIYVSDPGAKVVAGYSQDGNLQFLAGEKNEFVRPLGIAINDDLQRLYVVDTRAHKVKVLSLSGEHLFEFGKRGGEEGELNFPTGIAIDRQNGNVAVVDAENFRVQVFDRDGKFLKKFGQAGDGYGSFGMPKFAAIDREGNIYVTDGFMQNFQVFDRETNFLVYVMGAEKGQALGRFAHPGGIFADEQDRIFLADVTAGFVHEFQYLSDRWIKEHPDEYAKYLLLQPKETPLPGADEKAEK